MKFLIPFLALISASAATFQPDGIPFKSPVTVAAGFTADVVFSNLTSPRGIAFDSNNNLLVVERGLGVTAFTRVNSASTGWERTIILINPNLTHGIQVDGPRLYVSTAKNVLVYPYDPATKSVSSTVLPHPIIDGLPADGEILTHALQLETGPAGNPIGILVGSGPLSDIDITARDPASGRSQIRRFVFPNITLPVDPAIPLQWADGQILAYGIRNPAGFAFFPSPSVGPAFSKTIYVVENAPSIGQIPGFTPKFANDNPADELEIVNFDAGATPALPPMSYGCPDCSTLWNPIADPDNVPQYVGLPRGTQFSLNLPTPSTAVPRDDAWCRSATNNHPPALSFQAHSVPLDIKFYSPPTVSNTLSFPSTLSGHGFVSFHGSFDRSPPTGYGVVHVPFPLGGTSTDALGYSFVVQATLLNTCPGNCIRPVGLEFGPEGTLFVSSDSSGELFVIRRSAVVSSV